MLGCPVLDVSHAGLPLRQRSYYRAQGWHRSVTRHRDRVRECGDLAFFGVADNNGQTVDCKFALCELAGHVG